MIKKELICEHYATTHDESLDRMLAIEEFDEAMMGADAHTGRFIYSVHKCIEILMNKNQLTESQAYDTFEYRYKNLYIGHGRPIWCDDVVFNTYNRDEEAKRDS